MGVVISILGLCLLGVVGLCWQHHRSKPGTSGVEETSTNPENSQVEAGRDSRLPQQPLNSANDPAPPVSPAVERERQAAAATRGHKKFLEIVGKQITTRPDFFLTICERRRSFWEPDGYPSYFHKIMACVEAVEA